MPISTFMAAQKFLIQRKQATVSAETCLPGQARTHPLALLPVVKRGLWTSGHQQILSHLFPVDISLRAVCGPGITEPRVFFLQYRWLPVRQHRNEVPAAVLATALGKKPSLGQAPVLGAGAEQCPSQPAGYRERLRGAGPGSVPTYQAKQTN